MNAERNQNPEARSQKALNSSSLDVDIRRQFRLIAVLDVLKIVAAMVFGALAAIAYARGYHFELSGGWR